MTPPKPTRTIKQKLMTAIMGTSIVVLLLTCTAFIAYEVVTFRKSMVRGFTTRAEIIAANSTAALAFQNAADAAEILSAFRKDPHMVAACLYDSNGAVFARYPANAPLEAFPSIPAQPGYHFEKEHFVLFMPVMQGNRPFGTVYLKSDLSAMNERYRFYTVLVCVVVFTSILLAFALSARLRKRIADPILSLADTARALSERKDYSLRPRKLSDDEIGVLTDSFNDMLDEIQKQQSSLREKEARMRAILESALDCIITMDHEGRIVEFNPAAEKMFGYKRSQAVGAILADLIIPSGLREQHRQGMAHYLATGESTVLDTRVEVPGLRADGSEFPVELAITRIAQEGPPTFTGFIRDMTARKLAEQEIRQLNAELEQRVIERTAQLEASNKELEAFSYSVSHDLRAPLRSIDGFSKALIEEYRDKLDEEGKRYLERVRAATQRMALLIDDLLKLSRISRVELRREPVDLSDMAQQIAAELKQSEPQREVSFDIAEGLKVEGDSVLLRVVLDNLLRNAWKYTSKHPKAKIEFGTTNGTPDHTYFVRDDGAGFDMAHANLLFTPFQRLHRQNEFEGSGVGLATVHRIVQRHGGRLWAEAAIEKGATFYFIL
jgi:PAS domain S-box-containing protein